jgi:hypothetical protein
MQSVYRGSVKDLFRSKRAFLTWQQVVDPLSDYYQLLIVFSICCCWVAAGWLFTGGEQEGNSNPDRSQQEECT